MRKDAGHFAVREIFDDSDPWLGTEEYPKKLDLAISRIAKKYHLRMDSLCRVVVRKLAGQLTDRS